MRGFWIIVSIIAIILLFFIFRGESASTRELNNDQIAQITYIGILGVLVASSILASGIKLTHVIRNVFIWIVIGFALMVGYNNRYELQDIAHNLTAGIIPNSPISRYDENGLTVLLKRAPSGHFETRANVNGKKLNFMVDTGASTVVLSSEDAYDLGIDTRALNYTITVNTANGTAPAAPVILDSIKIGDIERKNIRAMVTQPDAMDGSLLGMSFLDRLSGYTVRGDQLILVD